MSYELHFFPNTRILRTHMWLDWEPPLPTPLSRWPEYFKVKLKVGAYHSCMLRTDTHLGLILSGNFLIGTLAESLLSERSVRTIRTSSDFSANKKTKKKASPSTWTRTVYPRLVWKTSFAWLFSKQMWEFQASFSLSMGYTQFGYIWGTKLKRGNVGFDLHKTLE